MSAVTETELQAFVDDHLDPGGRIEVIDHLLGDPASCRRTLLDLRGREALRVLAGAAERPSSRMVEAARQLERGIDRYERRWWRPAIAAAAAAMVVGAPMFALVVDRGSVPGPAAPPRYIEEAVEAHQVASLRQAMVSQVETPAFDSRELRAATRIRVPVLPEGWRISDVQVFPSDFGPALQLSIRTGEGGALFLFATHAQTGAPGRPQATRVSGTELAAWSGAGNTYVLSGALSSVRLLAVAHDLANNRLA